MRKAALPTIYADILTLFYGCGGVRIVTEGRLSKAREEPDGKGIILILFAGAK
jgi:hypothetical protein